MSEGFAVGGIHEEACPSWVASLKVASQKLPTKGFDSPIVWQLSAAFTIGDFHEETLSGDFHHTLLCVKSDVVLRRMNHVHIHI